MPLLFSPDKGKIFMFTAYTDYEIRSLSCFHLTYSFRTVLTVDFCQMTPTRVTHHYIRAGSPSCFRIPLLGSSKGDVWSVRDSTTHRTTEGC